MTDPRLTDQRGWIMRLVQNFAYYFGRGLMEAVVEYRRFRSPRSRAAISDGPGQRRLPGRRSRRGNRRTPKHDFNGNPLK